MGDFAASSPTPLPYFSGAYPPRNRQRRSPSWSTVRQLVAAFGSVPGDGNWNPEADLDGDQEVTLFDFGILVSNFGAIGDE